MKLPIGPIRLLVLLNFNLISCLDKFLDPHSTHKELHLEAGGFPYTYNNLFPETLLDVIFLIGQDSGVITWSGQALASDWARLIT